MNDPQPSAGVLTTGHPAVDEALRALDEVAAGPPAEQIAGYEQAHRVLQRTLETIDQG